MKSLVSALPLALVLAASALAGCAAGPSADRVRAVEQGALMKRRLGSYHVAYSDRSGPVGFMKVYDVQEAGGPVFRWSFVYDRDFNERGFVDQKGTAVRYDAYPPGIQPSGDAPIRFVTLPADSMPRNAARMLGLDPTADNLTFPVANEGDVR